MDIEKYRVHVKPLGLDASQETDLLTTLVSIMKNFALAAFGKHPIQQIPSVEKATATGLVATDSAAMVPLSTDAIIEAEHADKQREG